jgi:hypothetical protein
MVEREAHRNIQVLLTTVALTLFGCSGGEPANLTSPYLTVTPPKQVPETKRVAFQGVSSRGESNWVPGKVMVKLTKDREGKTELANMLIEPVREGAKYSYTAQFPPPRAKGKYYFHWTLYGEPVPGKQGQGSAPAGEPGVIEFETN